MRRHNRLWLAVFSLGATMVLNATSVPQAFLTCVSSVGTGATCQLPQGTYSVTTPIQVTRTGITIQGGSVTPTDTVLQRAANISSILTVQQGINVTIQFLTFDGNRFSSALSLQCLPGNSS